jgi:DedD protein
MDRRVKERLVGASILVVLLVLIVPELLSGPAPPPASSPAPSWPGAAAPRAGTPSYGTQTDGTQADGTQAGGTPATAAPERTVTVDLATSKAPAEEAVAEAASAARVQSAGERARASIAEPPLLPAATAAPHSAPPASLETPVPSPTSTPGGAKSAAGVQGAGPPAAVGHAWAVQLGSFASRDNADKLVRQWKGQGFSVYVSSVGAGSAARHRVRIGPLADREVAAQTVAKLKSMGQAGSIVRPGA